MMHPGRNDPCSCGSGQKYKKCCGLKHSAVSSSSDILIDEIRRSARKLDERMLRWSRLRLGEKWLTDAFDAYTSESRPDLFEAEEQFAMPWAMFHWQNPHEKASLAQIFLASERDQVPGDLLLLLEAHLNAWLGVWEVTRVEKGRGFEAVDQLTNQKRFIHEKKGTEKLKPRDSILGWVVDCKDLSIIGGMHPLALGPRDIDPIVREIRRLCHVRTRPASLECLARPMIQSALINEWRHAVDGLFNRPSSRLTNTDGDPFSPTTDYFDILSPDMSELLSRLAGTPGVEKSSPRGNQPAFVILREGNTKLKEWDNTVVGTIMIDRRRLCLETNSTSRADQLRQLLSTHLGGLIRYRLREEMGSAEMFLEDAKSQQDEPKAIVDPEAASLVRVMRNQYMTRWLDESIPILGGLTPREAIKTRRGKREVDILLRDFEHHEANLPEDQRIDINALRAELGLN